MHTRLVDDDIARSTLRNLVLDMARWALRAIAEMDVSKVPSRTGWVVIDDESSTFPTLKPVFNEPDFGQSFGLKAGYSRIEVDAVPEFINLMDFLGQHDDLWQFMTGFKEEGESGEHYARVSGYWIPVALAERHAATIGTTWDLQTAESIYEELENWLLGESLPVEAVYPILNLSFAQDEICIGDGLRIESVSNKLRRALHRSGQHSNMYTHVIIQSGLTIENDHSLFLLGALGAPDDLSKIGRVLHALTILTETNTGIDRVEYRPVGWARDYKADLPSVIPGAKIDGLRDLRITASIEPGQVVDAETCSKLPLLVQEIESTKGALAVSAKRLADASRRNDEVDAILDLCIGIEALLGDDAGDALYKTAVRTAAVLAVSDAANGLEPWEWIRTMRKIYAHRSRIAHGRAAPKGGWLVPVGDAEYTTRSVAEYVLRNLARHRAAHPDLGPSGIDQHIIAAALSQIAPGRLDGPAGALGEMHERPASSE